MRCDMLCHGEYASEYLSTVYNMNRNLWLVFGAIEMIGMMAILDAVFLQEPLILGVSFLFLLPGSLASVALYGPGHIGANWSIWTLGATAVITNLLLFSITTYLAAKYRRSSRVSTF